MRINPQYALAYQNLSAIQSGPLNQTEAAIRTLTDLLGFRPELTAIRASRAVLFARTGKFDEAFADLDLLKSEPLQEAMTMYQIACVYSLAAEAKSPNNDESINPGNLEYLQHSLQWTLRALSVDPKLYSLIESDPDSRWLRSQKPYSQLVEVLLGRDSNSK